MNKASTTGKNPVNPVHPVQEATDSLLQVMFSAARRTE